MTYPPQQPGQFNQSSYQGLGSFSGGQGGPEKKNTGKIVAIALIALLVLGGGGVAAYFLTKGGDETTNGTSSEQTNREDSKDTGSDDNPSDDASPDRDQEDEQDDSGSSNTPDDVRDDYMAAYENKDFADVVDSACRAYKTKFGTDTSELEAQLEDYDISAAPNGEVEIDDQHPDSATAKIDLTLVGDGQTQEPKILIKIVQESGQWRFCGEGTA
jgi:cytoskeletal protein RodZ